MLLFVIIIDKNIILENRFSFVVPVAGQLWMTKEPLSIHCTVSHMSNQTGELLDQLFCHSDTHCNTSKRNNMIIVADTGCTLYLDCHYYQLH